MVNKNHTAEYVTATCAVILTAAICAAFLLPLGAAFLPLFGGKNSVSFHIVNLFRITAYTFKIALGSTLIAAAVGIPAAFFTANRAFPGRKFLLSLSAVPFCIPPLIIALGFVSIFGMNGALNFILIKILHLKSQPFTFLYSTAGVVTAQGFYNFPLVMFIVSAAWEQLPADERNAARMLGAGESRIFFTVTIHQLSPAIAAACIPVFLYCFFSFMIVLLFGNIGGATLEIEIYQAARTTLDFKTASALALIETACAMAAIFLYSKIKPAYAAGSSAADYTYDRTKIGHSLYEGRITKIIEYCACALLAAVIVLFFICPLLGIFAGSTTGKDGINVFVKIINSEGFRHALCGTLITAPLSALLCVVTAFVYACILRTKDPAGQNTILQTLPMLPMAVSSVVMGYGMTLFLHRGTVSALIAAQAALAWPLAFRQIYASLCSIPQDTLDAARLLSDIPLDTVFRIMLPSCRYSIISAFSFCFAVGMGDTTLPLVLSVPRFDTLALYTYRLASSYRFAASCACGTILCVLCALVFAIGKKHE
jgi:thiamine transport system permease protein